MNPIVLLRSRAGVTQQGLALDAGTSQPTIALYEAGSKSPTWATLQKLASSQGFEAVVSYVPRLTREDQRSLMYHEAVVKIVRKNPGHCIKRARKTLEKMIIDHPDAKSLFQLWRDWLSLPTEELISHMLDLGVLSREMRQVSPFAGLLKPQDRVRILRKFRKEFYEKATV